MNQAEYEARYDSYMKELYQIANSITPQEYEALVLLSIQFIYKWVIVGTYQVQDQKTKLFQCENAKNGQMIWVGLSLTDHQIDPKICKRFISEGMIYFESCFTEFEKALAIEEFFVVEYDYIPDILGKIKRKIDTQLYPYQDLWE